MRFPALAIRAAGPVPTAASRVVPMRPVGSVAAPRRTVSIWLPVTPLALLLAAPAMVLSPLIRLDRRWRRLPVGRAAWAIGALLLALSGTQIEIDTPRLRLRLRIV